MQPDQIVSRFDEPIRRWFAARVGDPADAEDLAQETMLAVLESFQRFRGDCSLATWIYAVARNVLLKHIRGVRRRPLPLCPDEDLTDGSTDDRWIADRLTVQVIVAHLPPRLREVYNLYYCERLSTAEIATYLHRSQGTVKYQLYEVRRRVRAAIDR